jgi:RHS repeat-associated protein
MNRGAATGPACTLSSPASTAAVGSSLTLTATCSGQGPFTYTWTGPGVTGGSATTSINNVVIVTQTAGTTETYGVVAKNATSQGPRATLAIQVTANTAPSASWAGIPGAGMVLSPYQTTPISVQLVDPDPYQIRDVVFWVNGVAYASSSNGNGVWTYNWTPPASGVYVIQAQGHDATGARSQLLSTTVTVQDPPNASRLAIPGTSTVGTTAGSFAVSDLGAATYTVPIAVPPGVAGLQPSLALAFSSQGGTGFLGVGWSLTGMPVISRCQRTEATDQWKQQISYAGTTTDNVYCLDGQRLVWVGNGSDSHGNWNEYRTEIDTYSRIRSYGDVFDPTTGTWSKASPDYGPTATSPIIGGPARFELRTKSGQILHFAFRTWVLSNGYGQPGGRYNTLKAWPLDRVEDRAGNYMEIDYCGKQGTLKQSNGTPAGFVPLWLSDYCGINTPNAPLASGISTGPAVGAYPGTEFFPVQIRYGNKNGNSVGRVDMSYSPRDATGDDQYTTYDSGAGQSLLTKQLDKISTYSLVQGTWTGVKQYKLGYQISPASKRLELASLVECGDSDFSACLTAPPGGQPTGTRFTWTSPPSIGFGQATASGMAIEVDPERIADLDGDGRSDIIRLNVSSASPNFDVCLATATGFNCPASWPIVGGPAPGASSQWWLGDFNGDGLVDVAYTYDDGSASYATVAVCYSTGTSFASCVTHDSSGNPIVLKNGGDPAFQADLNGDGRIDLTFYLGDGHWRVYLSNGQGFAAPVEVGPLELPNCKNLTAAPPLTDKCQVGTDIQHQVMMADVDGDGRADWILRRTNNDGDTAIDSDDTVPHNEEWLVCFSNFQPGNIPQPASPVACTTNYVRLVPSQVNTLTVADFNGDGLADIAAPLPFSSSNPDPGSGATLRKWRICLSIGDGSFNCSDYNGPNARDYGDFDRKAVANTVFGDFNGDGRTDYAALVMNGTQWEVCLAKGKSPSAQGLTTTQPLLDFDCSTLSGPLSGAVQPLSGDFDGDGRTDLEFGLQVAKTPSQATTAETITSITNGLGATIAIDYRPLTDSSVYARNAVSLEDGRSLLMQSPLLVVKTTRASTATAYTYDTNYAYESLVGRTTGRGLMGFARKTVTETVGDDPAYQVNTTTDFQQTWPRAGRPLKVVKAVGKASLTISETDFDWEPIVPVTNGGLPVQLVLYQQTDKPFEINGGGALPWTVTTTPLGNVDVNGNIGRVETYTTDGTATPDGYKKITTSEYCGLTASPCTEDTTNWIIGRATKVSVQSILPDISSATRTSSFDYYMGAADFRIGLLRTETIEPGQAGTPLSMATTYDYDPFGNRSSSLKQFVDNGVQASRRTFTRYDAYGRFVSSVSAYINGTYQTENRSYDERFGAIATSTDPNSITASTTYDGFGRKVSQSVTDATSNLMSQTTWTLSASGSGYEVEMATNTGTGSRVQYDNLGREIAALTKTFRSSFAGTSTTYDSRGRKASVTRPYADGTTNPAGTIRSTAWTYDAASRILTEADYPTSSPTGTPTRTTTLAYSLITTKDVSATPSVRTAAASVVTTIRSNTVPGPSGPSTPSQITSKASNSQGQVFKATDAAGNDTLYAYDALGNLICVTPPASTTAGYTPGTAGFDYRCTSDASRTGLQVRTVYDLRGRKTNLTDPDTGAWSYGYNGADELIQQTDASGNVTKIKYDDLGRIQSRIVTPYPNGPAPTQVAWTYDSCKTGKLCSVDRDSGRVVKTFQYDNQTRPFLTELDVDGRKFVTRTLYDTEGRQSVISYPGDVAGNAGISVSQSYNAAGYMQRIHDNADNVDVWTADARFDDGQVLQSHLGGNYITRGYDELGRVNHINALAPANLSLTYDSLGNLISRTSSSPEPLDNFTEGFGYDLLNRLTKVCADAVCASVTKAYSYDNVGSSTAYTYAAGTHQVSSANGKSYLYDKNGNLSTTSDGLFASWASFNMPASLGALLFDYDGDFTRVKEATPGTVTYYSTPGFFEQVETTGQTTLRNYIQSPEGPVAVVNVVRSSSGTQTTSLTYWVKDHLGSVVAEISGADGSFKRLGFDAWGNRRDVGSGTNGSTFASHRGFTGHEMLDDFGLIHMNGRIYNPTIGKFLSPDPVVQEAFNVQNYNRYVYVLNNPLSLTDPTGFSWWTNNGRGALRGVAAIVVAYFTGYYVTQYVGAGTTAGAFAGAAAGGFAAGGIAGGNLKSAVQGAFTGLAFAAAGEYVTAQGPILDEDLMAARIVSHAIAGCASSAVAGGGCYSGVVSATAGVGADSINVGSGLGNAFVHAGAGALAAGITGGNPYIGASVAAFGYVFNCLAHKCSGADYDPSNRFFHQYGPFESPVLCNISSIFCLDAARQQLGCASAIQQGGCTEVGQERYYMLPGGNPISQYRPSPDVIINGTSLDHVLHDGYVVRWIGVADNGDVSIWTYGRGVNQSSFLKYFNQYGGEFLFRNQGAANATAVRPFSFGF